MKKIYWIFAGILLSIIWLASCEKNTEDRQVIYAVKGLTSDYKVTYVIQGTSYAETIQGGTDFSKSFYASPGEVLYFDIKYKDNLNKMSGFSALITVDKKILKESYAYDMKWADSATANIPYPFEIILNGTVPY